MTDHLGIGLSEEPEHEPGGPSYGRRRAAVLIVAVAVIVVLAAVGVLGVRAFKAVFGAPADYSGAGFGSVTVQIHTGDSLTAIGHDLQQAGVVESAGAFTDAANDNSRAGTIGPGFYRLHRHMKASLALTLLLDPSSLITSRVVIPEGTRMQAILQKISDVTQISMVDLTAAAKSPSSLGVPSWGRGHPLEGFLFPATYDFAPGTTAKQALSAMVTRFKQEAAALKLAVRARQAHRSPYDVLTVASIVEREGRLTPDFPRIAEVFYNRLARGMPLQSDATLFYVLPPDHGPLTNADLHLNSPYNTRTHPGLPPTPIASPGSLALQAALHPATGNYLYFVTIDKAGHTAFATTLQQFNQLVAESRNNGVQ